MKHLIFVLSITLLTFVSCTKPQSIEPMQQTNRTAPCVTIKYVERPPQSLIDAAIGGSYDEWVDTVQAVKYSSSPELYKIQTTTYYGRDHGVLYVGSTKDTRSVSGELLTIITDHVNKRGGSRVQSCSRCMDSTNTIRGVITEIKD